MIVAYVSLLQLWGQRPIREQPHRRMHKTSGDRADVPPLGGLRSASGVGASPAMGIDRDSPEDERLDRGGGQHNLAHILEQKKVQIIWASYLRVLLTSFSVTKAF